jgi:hypothetical protein
MAILHLRPAADRYISHYFSNAVVPEFSCSLRRKISYGAHKKSVGFLRRFSQHCEKRLSASSRRSVRTEQLGYHWMDFHEI